MSSDASAVEVAISRISPAPAPPSSYMPSDELERLASWWQRVGSSAEPQATWVTSPGVNVAEGLALAERTIDAGSNLLIAHLPDHDPATARALIGVLCHRDAAAVTFQPAGMTDAQWAVQCELTRDHIAAWLSMRGEPMELLKAARDVGITAMVGCLLEAAARRTPVILDGIRVFAAAVVADRLAPQAGTWWRGASGSPDPAFTIASERIDLESGLPLAISSSDARAGRAALALLKEVTEPASGPI